MMGYRFADGATGNMMGAFGFWGTLTWLLLVVFLVLGSMYFWKGINKKK